MTNEKNQKENRRALKTFIPILVISTIVGAFLGTLTSKVDIQEYADKMQNGLSNFFYFISPYGIPVILLITIGIVMIFYIRCRSLYNKLGDEDEVLSDNINTDLNIALTILNSGMIISFLFVGIMFGRLEDYFRTSMVLFIISIGSFIIGNFLILKVQQMVVDFTKLMNPQRSGSVYDVKFVSKWEESCDELEKLIIYKSAYRSYRVTNLACMIIWVFVTFFSRLFHIGTFSVVLVTAIWLILTLTYCIEACRLEKAKVNQ